MAHNPLFSVLPVDCSNELFIGRENEIDLILTAVNEKGQNVSLIGETKIGKSSILRKIQFEVQRPEFEKIVYVYLDLERFDYDLQTESLLTRILNKVYAANEELTEKFKHYARGKMNEFSEVVDYCTRRKIIILLALDNFDAVTVLKNLSVDFFSFLRANASERGLSIITASRNKLETLCHKGELAGSKFWAVFNPVISLSLYEKIEHAMELIEHEIRAEKLRAMIVKYAGAHPCYLKVAGNTIIRNNLTEISTEESIVEAIYEDMIPYFEKTIKLLKADEKNVENDIHYKVEYLSTLYSIIDDQLNVTTAKRREINNLKQMGYIYDTNGKLEIYSPLFLKYLEEHKRELS
jgi:hypothetical protein